MTGHGNGDTTTDTGTDTVMGERRRLVNLAYRLLGSVAEAEDAVQETFARWYAMSAAERDAIRVPAAWLSRVAGRVCLDQLGSARVRRERYVGEWLPEPVSGRAEWVEGWGGEGLGADPAERVAEDESLSMAFLVVLEALTPAERVAFVLHEVFRYPFPEIAEIVGRTPAACRQLATSARRRVEAARSADGAATTVAQQADVVRDFRQAWAAKDIAALVGLLDPDAVTVADGGGLVLAALEPLVGAEAIAGYLVGLSVRAAEAGVAMDLVEVAVNGRPGLLVLNAAEEEPVVAVFAFEVAGDRVSRVWAMRNPEKLSTWRGGAEESAEVS